MCVKHGIEPNNFPNQTIKKLCDIYFANELLIY